METLAFQRVATCVVLVHTKQNPSAREWSAYVSYLTTHNVPKTKILVVTDGGAPSAAQRRELTDVINAVYGGDVPTAVMTTSPIARGVVTALGWLFPSKLRAYPPEGLEDALSYLDVPSGFRTDVKKVISELEGRLRAQLAS